MHQVFVDNSHFNAERPVSQILYHGKSVALRPGRSMSDMLTFSRVDPGGIIRDKQDPDDHVSLHDNALVATAVLTNDNSKHGDFVYELVGVSLDRNTRAEILSTVSGKTITYLNGDYVVMDKYDQFIKLGIPDSLAWRFALVLISEL